MKNLVVKYFLVGLLLIALCTVLFVGCDSSKKGGETGNNKVEETTACEHTIDWKTTKEPTCAAEGLRQYVCSKCGLVKNEESIPKTTEHTMVNGTCSVCGISNEGSQGLEYELAGDEYTVVGIGTYTDSKLMISSTYNGLKVTRIKDAAFKDCQQLTEVVVSEGIEYIGSEAFANCDNLQTASVMCAVSWLHATFEGCDNLTNVTLNNKIDGLSWYVFKDCTALNEITIPASITQIGASAFEGCTNLSKILFAENSKLETVDFSAFEDCEKLTEISLPNSVTSIDGSAFRNSGIQSFTIPDGVKEISEDFIWQGLTSLTLPNNNELIISDSDSSGSINLGEWSTLTNINIPSNFTADLPFEYASSLASITVAENNERYVSYTGVLYDKTDTSDIKIVFVPENITGRVEIMSGVKSIDKNTFEYRTLMEAIILPDTLVSIDKDAFVRCYDLTEIHLPAGATLDALNIPDSVASITVSANHPKYVSQNGIVYDKTNASNVKIVFVPKEISGHVNIMAGVQTLDDKIFCNRTALESVSLPDSLVMIGKEVFRGCTGLKSVNIPTSLLRIDNLAFNGCTSLENITLSNAERLSIIGEKAFADCSSLKDIYLPASADDVGKSAFEGCTSLEYLSMSRIGYNTKAGFIGYFFGASSYHDNSKYVPASLKYVSVGNETVTMNCAFYGCKNIETVVFGPLVKYIGQSCFQGCTALTSVKIMNYNGISIYGSAFDGCTNLNKIEVAFSTSKWSSITKQDGWDTNTGNYQVYCTDGTLSK